MDNRPQAPVGEAVDIGAKATAAGMGHEQVEVGQAGEAGAQTLQALVPQALVAGQVEGDQVGEPRGQGPGARGGHAQVQGRVQAQGGVQVHGGAVRQLQVPHLRPRQWHWSCRYKTLGGPQQVVFEGGYLAGQAGTDAIAPGKQVAEHNTGDLRQASQRRMRALAVGGQ